MSLHIFKAKSTSDGMLHIQMGFDSPMDWYFMTIFTMTDEGKAANLKWSNLDHDNPETLTLDFFERVLAEMGISVPNSNIENIEQDRNSRRMNHRIEYHHV
ncbi:MAG: hypothetical protein ACJAS1_006702 [Oleiphilaceae bacterium]|jgi:hypothetical protein